MRQISDFSGVMAAWAAREPSVKALVLFGSQVHSKSDFHPNADAQSDWDFQIVTSRPTMFSGSAWLHQATGTKPRVYAIRTPRIGAMPKINAVLTENEADFVIIPARTFHLARFAVKLGLHRPAGRLRRSLQDLSVVIRPGYRFLKGGAIWDDFYRRVIDEVSDLRLNDAAARNLAEGFVYDYLWSLRKLERGELVAVQRMLYRELTETNFRLMHELKLRRNERSFPDARRFEQVANLEELENMSICAPAQKDSLQLAVAQSAMTLRRIMYALAGDTWCWPTI